MSDTSGYELWPLFERSWDGVLLFAADSRQVVRANTAAAEMFGRAFDLLVGCLIDDLFEPASLEVINDQFECAFHDRSSREPILVRLTTDKERSRVAGFQAVRLILDRAVVMGALLQSVQHPWQHWLRLDPLTRISDRAHLKQSLSDVLRRSGHGNKFAALFIDIDNFKSINDQHGHLAGDSVLRDIAERLRVCVGNDHALARYGGDEFVVLVENVVKLSEIDALVKRIREAIALPIKTPDGEVVMKSSVGVAVGPAQYKTPEDVIAAADRAMYEAKRM